MWIASRFDSIAAFEVNIGRQEASDGVDELKVWVVCFMEGQKAVERARHDAEQTLRRGGCDAHVKLVLLC